MTVKLIYKDGTFKPTEPVNLPEGTAVEVNLPANGTDTDDTLDAVYAVLREQYTSGEHDIAERHNEHQP